MSTNTPSAGPSAAPQRPLSPFMIGPYYRPQLTSMLSILHRATGVFLSLGSVLLVGWLVAAASGPEAYDCAQRMIRAWYGQLLLFGWSYALFYHLCNGIRHLVWDAGYGFDLKSVYWGGYLMVVVSIVLTVFAWTLAWA
ncbi:MAG TPA: succinate dehydrogenase, cytochrome b556 subunit [Nevskiales bacterium]|nr:succinate dehydrogenase, cytochrome b556 subunit [Nevskiales bacterium]